MGIFAEQVRGRGELELVEQRHHPRFHLPSVTIRGLKKISQLGSNREERVCGTKWILRNEGNGLATNHGIAFIFLHSKYIMALKQDSSFRNFSRRRRDDIQNGPAQSGFTGSAFTNQGQNLSFIQINI